MAQNMASALFEGFDHLVGRHARSERERERRREEDNKGVEPEIGDENDDREDRSGGKGDGK